MHALKYMAFAVITMSFYPLVIIYGAPMGPFTYTLIATTFSAICAIIGMIILLKVKPYLKQDMRVYFSKLGTDDFLQLGIIGICNALTHVFFLFSLQIMSSGGAAIIFEIWPILAMFLSTFLITKKWDKIEIKHYVYALLGLCGVILIGVADTRESSLSHSALENAWFSDTFFTLGGAVLAFMAAIMSALFVVFRVEYSNKLKTVSNNLSNDIDATIIGEAICRISTLPPLILAIIVMPPEYGEINLTTLSSAFFIGVFALYFTNMAFTIAVLKSTTPLIQIVWYFVPVLAIIWLSLFNLSTITLYILIGMAMVIAANFMISSERFLKRKKMPGK